MAITMPPLYEEPENENENYSSAKPDVVPVVDLTAADATTMIRRACETWGIFQLVGHGVPMPAVEELDAQARRLFSLSVNEKMKVARPHGGRAGYGSVPIWENSTFEKQALSEGFTILGSPSDHASRLWPEDPNKFSDVMEEYQKEMKKLARKLLDLMILSLGFTEEEVRRADPIGDGYDVLQLNWYPNGPEPGQAIGMAAHSDSSLIAILYQDSNASGLQVMRPKDKHGPARWVTVSPIPASLVVHVGDLGHIISNGRFHNVLHRAIIVKRDQPRLSVVYAYGPSNKTKVSPVVGSGLTAPPRYRAVTWPEFRELKATQGDKVYAAISTRENGGSTEQINTGIVVGE